MYVQHPPLSNFPFTAQLAPFQFLACGSFNSCFQDEVVKYSPHARAIRDVEDEELRSFFYGMSPWQVCEARFL
jgi:hypothetical protein